MRFYAAILMFLTGLVQANESEPLLIHSFESDGHMVGYLYGVPTKEMEDAFEVLEIRDRDFGAYKVLYKITRTAMYKIDNVIDEKIHDDGSHGFYLVIKRPTYIDVGCCKIRESHNGAMDSIIIEWNRKEEKFELLRTP